MVAKLIHRVAGALSAGSSVRAATPVASPARVPDGMRVYAIGDVHGRADLLEEAFARIEAHDAAAPLGTSVVVTLGDYVDRGLHSRAVIDLLIDWSRCRHLVAICGNHEAYMLQALHDPAMALKWLAAGGRETLYSYDVVVPTHVDIDTASTVMSRAAERIPEAHKTFLGATLLYATIGDYAFVHAGIRPGAALVDQAAADLMTIRQPFLDHRRPHDYVVVHGHTPVGTADFRANRINIDTGAYITGVLTCLVLEGRDQFLL